MRPFRQVDVFGSTAFGGNPVAVILDAEGLSTEEMQRIATWTNLSETTFVLAPTRPEADYRVRIFTGSGELPFAGHPTLGTCHAWGGEGDHFVQECAAGLIDIRRTDQGLAFKAPPLRRDGPVEPELAAEVRRVLGVEDVVDMKWCDNGPGWVGVLLEDADAVLALRPERSPLDIGVAGVGGAADWEVRCFFDGTEDPITGSFNAALAQWLMGSGRATAPYVAAQGTAIGRSGRVHVEHGGGRRLDRRGHGHPHRWCHHHRLMDLTFTDSETAFQQELRGWFESHDAGPQPDRHDEAAHYKWRIDWQRQLADDGWAAPHWPAEYGGRNASLTESAIFFEELGRSRSPLPANVLGILLAGPTIMAWGTPEQKERYLQPILTAEEIWCQGFSEPEAGSDLASLKSYATQGRATSGSSTARRCGRRGRSSRSGACSSRAPTATSPSTRG